jgi:hypothetical protein
VSSEIGGKSVSSVSSVSLELFRGLRPMKPVALPVFPDKLPPTSYFLIISDIFVKLDILSEV